MQMVFRRVYAVSDWSCQEFIIRELGARPGVYVCELSQICLNISGFVIFGGGLSDNVFAEFYNFGSSTLVSWSAILSVLFGFDDDLISMHYHCGGFLGYIWDSFLECFFFGVYFLR